MKKLFSLLIFALVVMSVAITCASCQKEHTHTPGNEIVENEVAATCTEGGSYDLATYCTECNEELSRTTKVTKPAGHKNASPVVENEQEGSCTVDELHDEVVYCSVCDFEISRKQVVDKKAPGHVEAAAVNETIAATCTTHGHTDKVVYCQVCNEEMSRKEISYDAVPLGHTPADAIVENLEKSTCTENGSYDQVVNCSVCKIEINRIECVLPIDPHTPDVRDEVIKPATCLESGSHIEITYCSECGVELDRKTVVDAKLIHSGTKEVIENFVNFTCDTDGSYDIAVRCIDCELEDKAKRTHVDVPAHHVAAEPVPEDKPVPSGESCTYDLVTYCKHCLTELDRETVNRKPHTASSPIQENIVTVTCSRNGTHDDVVYCAICSMELSRTLVTDAEGGCIFVDKQCTRCNEYDTSVGLEYTLSEDKSHWIVSSVGSCTDEYVIIPRTYTGNYTDPETKETTTYTLPVTEIDRWAFYDCDTVKRLLILKEISVIPDMAFYSCDNLFRIIVEQDNRTYRSADGNLYTKDGKKLMQYAIGKISTSFKVPDDVVEIGYGAFACCTNLSKIEIGSAVTTISESAFAYCTSLTEVAIPNKVTTIGEAAFADCHNITKVTIGTGVKSIGKGAFASCTKLTSVTFANTTGWKVSTTETGSKTGVNATELKDAAKAANLITTKYMNYYWTR